mgnify:CR=1 FL=1
MVPQKPKKLSYRERAKLASQAKTQKALTRAAEMYNTGERSILDGRHAEVVEPRFLIYLAARAAGASFPMIAKVMRKKDHSGIIYGCRRALQIIDNDPGARAIFEELYDVASIATEHDIIDMGEMSHAANDDEETDPYEIPLSRVRSSLTGVDPLARVRRKQPQDRQDCHQRQVQGLYDPHALPRGASDLSGLLSSLG